MKSEGLRHEDVVNSIGNLTLLLGPKNVRASNKSFDKKKSMYADSEAPINEYLASLPQFGPSDLKERARRLAELAVRVWTLEP